MFELIEFLQLFTCCCLHCNDPNILHTLCLFIHLVLSLICGFKKEFCQTYQFNWVTKNIWVATIYLMKICIEFLLTIWLFSSLLTMLHLHWIHKFYYYSRIMKQMQEEFETKTVGYLSTLKILWWNTSHLLVFFCATDALMMWPFVAVGWDSWCLEMIKT